MALCAFDSRTLQGSKERLKEYHAEFGELETKKKSHDGLKAKRESKTEEISTLREEDKVLSEKLDSLVSMAGGSAGGGSVHNDKITSLMDEKAKLVASIKEVKQSIKDATVSYKIKAAEYKEYLQAKQGYERKLERNKYQARKAEQALRNAQWNETKEERDAERKRRMQKQEARFAAVAAGCQLFVGGLSSRCSEDQLWDFFGEMGTVTDVMIAVDRDSGTSKGFGFVVFAEEAKALKVVEECDGQSIPGVSHKTISLKQAEKSRIQLEWEEKNPPETRPPVDPPSRPRKEKAPDGELGAAAGARADDVGGQRDEDDGAALPKREKKGVKGDSTGEPHIIVNVPTSDTPQVFHVCVETCGVQCPQVM